MNIKRSVLFFIVLLLLLSLNFVFVIVPLYLPLYPKTMDVVTGDISIDIDVPYIYPARGGGVFLTGYDGKSYDTVYKFYDTSLKEVQNLKQISVMRSGRLVSYDQNLIFLISSSSIFIYREGIPDSIFLHRNFFPEEYLSAKIIDVQLLNIYKFGEDSYVIEANYKIQNGTRTFRLTNFYLFEDGKFELLFYDTFIKDMNINIPVSMRYGNLLYIISSASFMFSTEPTEPYKIYLRVLSLDTLKLSVKEVNIPPTIQEDDSILYQLFFWEHRTYILFFTQASNSSSIYQIQILDYKQNLVIYSQEAYNPYIYWSIFAPTSEVFGSPLFLPVWWQLEENGDSVITGLMFDDDSLPQFSPIIESKMAMLGDDYGVLSLIFIDDAGRTYYFNLRLGNTMLRVTVKTPNNFGMSVSFFNSNDVRNNILLTQIVVLASLVIMKYLGKRRGRSSKVLAEEEVGETLYPSLKSN